MKIIELKQKQRAAKNNALSKALAIDMEEAKKAGFLGYMSRTMIQATLPYSDPKTCIFTRRNGNLELNIFASPSIGMPYGTIPRLILAWICTEAVKRKSPLLSLGRNLNEFMKMLGLARNGRDIARFKKQSKRLFASSISCVYEDLDKTIIENLQTINKAELVWETKEAEKSFLVLNENFFSEITSRPVPIDLRVIKAIKNSSFALDIYMWLTYRMSYLRKITRVPWKYLQMQFGANYIDNKAGRYEFKRQFQQQMLKVLNYYPEATVEQYKDGIILVPSKAHISKLKTAS